MDDVTATMWARGTIRAEMTKRGLTYADLTAKLNSYGLDENERNLRNKIARGTFSAAFFLQCLAAMDVDYIDINGLPVADHIKSGAVTRKSFAAIHAPEHRADAEAHVAGIETVIEANEKARKGE